MLYTQKCIASEIRKNLIVMQKSIIKIINIKTSESHEFFIMGKQTRD